MSELEELLADLGPGGFPGRIFQQAQTWSSIAETEGDKEFAPPEGIPEAIERPVEGHASDRIHGRDGIALPEAVDQVAPRLLHAPDEDQVDLCLTTGLKVAFSLVPRV